MDKESIHLSDLQRILLGEAPAEFLLEVTVRSVLTYIFLLVIMKLLGKRMSGRLTNMEMSVMLMLGAVVSLKTGTFVNACSLIPEDPAARHSCRPIWPSCFVSVTGIYSV